MKRFFFYLMAITFSGLVFAGNPINKIVVFGDSLSDKKNLYGFTDHLFPNSPPYYEGRFSNGIIWIEKLATILFPNDPDAHILNYAFGGAAIFSEKDDDGSGDALSLNYEIDSLYLQSHNDKADENALYIIWIGANNYVDNLYNKVDKNHPERYLSPEVCLDLVRQGIRDNLVKLASKGAKHFLLVGLPDLSKSPYGRLLTRENQQEMSYLCLRHNQILAQTINELRGRFPTVDWTYFEINDYVASILSNPAQYGFTHIKSACLDNESTALAAPAFEGLLRKQISPLLNKAFLKGLSNASQVPMACDGYLFFDHLHPTSVAHQLFAKAMWAFLISQHFVFST